MTALPLTIRFHWTVSRTDTIDTRLCRQAELCGIESMRIPVDFTCPQPLEQVMRLGRETGKIRFMLACRSAPPSAESYCEQIDGVERLLPGRILTEFECGHAPHEQFRDFLGACRRLRTHDRPEMFVTGNSAEAAELGIRYGSCVFQCPGADEQFRGQVGPLLHFGVDAGFFSFLIARATREEAIDAVRKLRASFEKQPGQQRAAGAAVQASGLWSGWNPVPDAPPIAMFGSFEEVAQAILRYQRRGITQFLFMGWPATQEIEYFRRGVLPLLQA